MQSVHFVNTQEKHQQRDSFISAFSFIINECYSKPKYRSLPSSTLKLKLFGQGRFVEYEKSSNFHFLIEDDEQTSSLNFIYLFDVVK